MLPLPKEPPSSFHLAESIAVPSLQGAIHAKVEQPSAVLHNAVHIVARQSILSLIVMPDDPKLIAVITVDSIASGYP